MAKRTIETGYFGSVGMSDPLSSFSERTLRVAWDFGRKAVPENKTIPLMQLPKGFLIDRISVVQTKAVNAAATVTFGLGSDDTKVVGGNFALVASGTLLRSSQAPAVGAQPTVTTTLSGTVDPSTGSVAGVTASSSASGGSGAGSLFIEADDILCLVVPDGITGDELNVGAFDLCIHGFEAFAEGVAANGEANPLRVDDYRLPLQSAANEESNVSGGQFPQDIND